MCGDQDRCVTGSQTGGINGNDDFGQQKGKEETVSFEVPGFEDSLEDSIDMVQTREYIVKTEVNKNSIQSNKFYT